MIMLAVHFIGDFLFQSNWMALNKSRRVLPLLAHVSAYTAAFVPMALALFPQAHHMVGFLLLTFGLHVLVDAVTSRITQALWFVDLERCDSVIRQDGFPYWVSFNDIKRHWFFVVIGFDQLLHAACLAWAYTVFA